MKLTILVKPLVAYGMCCLLFEGCSDNKTAQDGGNDAISTTDANVDVLSQKDVLISDTSATDVSETSQDALEDSTQPCSIIGSWKYTHDTFGEVIDTFSDNGTTTMNGTGFTFHGTFTFIGDILKIKHSDHVVCKSSDEGEYKIKFASDCMSYVLTMVVDPCSVRATVADYTHTKVP